MAWLSEPLGDDEQDGVTPFAPRCVKDQIEEGLFHRRRDLFSQLALFFYDTTSIYFEGRGGESIGQYGHSKDHRPDRLWMIVGVVLAGPCAANYRLSKASVYRYLGEKESSNDLAER